jgi:hypothetical protein
MGLFDWLGGGAGKAVKGTLEGAGSLAKDLRSAITGDISAEKKAELELKAKEIESQILKAQNEVNREEAKSKKLFVAGWRPFIGWVGGVTLAFHYVLRPLIQWGMEVWGGEILELPMMDLSGMYPIILGMLGLGVYRTAEKVKGVQDKH